MNYEVDAKDSSSSDAIDIFKKNGFLIVRGLFEVGLIEEIFSSIKDLNESDWKNNYGGRTAFIKNHTKTGSQSLFGVSYAQPITAYAPLAMKLYGQELVSVSSFLLGVNDAFYKESELHVRHNNYKHQIPSHQDNFYFGLKNPTALTCYVYLTQQDQNSGGLGFMRGCETLEHEQGNIEGFSSYHANTEEKRNEFFYPVTKPGDVVFHHCNTFHRADENKTDKLTASISTRVFSRSNLSKDENLQKIYRSNLRHNRGI